MRAHTKKHPTDKKIYPELQLILGGVTHTYNNVQNDKIDQILDILEDDETYVSADTLYLEKIDKLDGVPEYKRSAYFVRSARKEKAYTQNTLASMLGITQANLSSLENAKRPIGKKLAEKLSEVFGVGYKVFLTDLPKNISN